MEKIFVLSALLFAYSWISSGQINCGKPPVFHSWAKTPSMFGGNLPDNDEFTLSLITNREVLYVNRHSIENRQLFSNGEKIAWTATDPETGDKFLALFNTSDQEDAKDKENWRISVDPELLGCKGTCVVKDLWSGENIGEFSGEVYQNIKPHAAGLFRISERK